VHTADFFSISLLYALLAELCLSSVQKGAVGKKVVLVNRGGGRQNAISVEC